MKEIQISGSTYLLVDFPIGSISFAIWEVQNGFSKVGKKGDFILSYKPINSEFVHIVLPAGNWVIVGQDHQLTEDQWKGIGMDKNDLASHGYEFYKTLILVKQ